MKKGPFRLRSQSAVRKRGFKHMGSTFRDTDPHTSGHDHDKSGNVITWDKEKLISDVTEETDVDVTRTRGYETEGTSEDPRLTEFKKRCYDENGNRLVGKAGCVWEDGKEDPADIKHVKGREDVDVTPKEKKKCECQAYKADGSKGPMVEYPCDGPKNPNCEPPTDKKGSKCQCMNTKTREMISYECPEPGCKCPKPAECATKKNGGGKKKKKKKRRKLNLKYVWKRIKGKMTKICQGEDCPAYD